MAQTREADWYSLQGAVPSPFRQQIERLVSDVLGRRYALASSSVPLASVYTKLANHGAKDLVFVAGSATEIGTLVRNDRFGLVHTLGLEVINMRLAAAPLFLFTKAGDARLLEKAAPGTALRVLYASRAGDLKRDDLQALLTRVLKVNPIVLQPLNSPDELARRLLTDVSVVGIYDNDPSPFLHEFLTSYERESAGRVTPSHRLQLLEMLVFPTQTGDVQSHRLQTVGEEVTFTVGRFGDVALEALTKVPPVQKDGVLAVSSPLGSFAPDSIWILSNVRNAVNEKERSDVRQLLGDAYFISLFTQQDFLKRCETGTRPGYGMYFLDAYLGHRESLTKGLSLWSDLVMRVGSGKTDEAALTDQRTLIEAMLNDRLGVRMSTSTGRTGLLKKLQGPSGTVRQQFSDAEGKLFEQAVADIRRAVTLGAGAERKQLLNIARAKLLELIKKGADPTCRGVRELGLFGRELDPYFYLGLLEAHEKLDAAIGGKASSTAATGK